MHARYLNYGYSKHAEMSASVAVCVLTVGLQKVQLLPKSPFCSLNLNRRALQCVYFSNFALKLMWAGLPQSLAPPTNGSCGEGGEAHLWEEEDSCFSHQRALP